MRDGSLDRLVVEHLPMALAFATRLAGSPDRAEDIVQEALVRVVRSWQTFRGEAAFRTWFFRIIINVFRDGLAAASDQPISAGEQCIEPCDAPAADPLATAMAAELERLVAVEVSRLPPRQREVLILSVYEGMSSRDVALAVGISEANVHSTLSVARARLKQRLATYFKSVEE